MIRTSKLPLNRQNNTIHSMNSRTAAKPSAVLALLGALSLAAVSVRSAPEVNLPAIQGVEVDNRPLSWQPGQELNLGSFPRNIIFNIGPETNSSQKFMRLRTKLEGIDKDWRDGGGTMYVALRFYNGSGDLVAEKGFEAHGESAGWNGTLESSTFTHRRETFSAPPGASRLWVI